MSTQPTPIHYQGFPSSSALQPNIMPPSPLHSLNELPHQASFLSSNYKISQQEQQQQLMLEQQKPIEEQFMKIGQQMSEIDEDEIIRMFKEKNNKSHLKDKQILQMKKKHSNNNNYKQTNSNPQTKPKPKSITLREETSLKFIKDFSYKELPVHMKLSAIVLEQIKYLIMIYKTQYRSSIFDQEYQKQRYKNREQLFEQLVIGVYEMKEKAEYQLIPQQKEVLLNIDLINKAHQHNVSHKFSYDYEVWKYCRGIVLEIQLELFIHFHSRMKPISPVLILSKQYKILLKNIITNLRDQDNYELRLKLLSKTLAAEQLKTIKEIELFNETKREEIKEKQRKLLMQFSTQRQNTVNVMSGYRDDEHQNQNKYSSYLYNNNLQAQKHKLLNTTNNNKQSNNNSNNNNNNKQIVTSSLNPSDTHIQIAKSTSFYKYVDENTISMLQNLVSKDHLYKMRERLEQDLKGDLKDKCVRKFLQEFIYDL